jgi:glycerol-3-phosphate cytidylyltransferase
VSINGQVRAPETLVGYTAGVFDCFHIGHVNLLRAAREQCGHLVVGVTTDELAEDRKGGRPLIPFMERMEIVQSVRYVDHVLPQTTMDKVVAWRTVQYDLLFVGDNMRDSPDWVATEQHVAEVGARLVYLPYTSTRAEVVGRWDAERRMGE